MMISRSFSSGIAHPVYSVSVKAVAGALALLLRLLKATWRLDTSGRLKLERMLEEGKPTIVVFWHGNMVPLLAVFDGYSANVISSAGFRGTVIGKITRSFGNLSVQIERRGPLSPLQAILTEQRGLLAIAVDGPMGPYHHVKPGAVVLSATCGARIVPVSVHASPALTLARWDEMIIPTPFAKVSVRVGEPMYFSQDDLKRTDCAVETVRAALKEGDP